MQEAGRSAGMGHVPYLPDCLVRCLRFHVLWQWQWQQWSVRGRQVDETRALDPWCAARIKPDQPRPAGAGDQPGLTVTITPRGTPAPWYCVPGGGAAVGRLRMYIHSTLHQAPSTWPSTQVRVASRMDTQRQEGGRREGEGAEQSARGWHGLRRFDSEVGLCMVSARERLGKRFLLLARTGQGLLAFAKPNRLSDQDKIQNFPPSQEARGTPRRNSSYTRTSDQGSSLAVLLIDGWEAPCWSLMGLPSLTGW